MRQGIGSALLGAVLARAAEREIERLYTEASEFSRPVFERFGFRVTSVETVERRRVSFQRYRMERHG